MPPPGLHLLAASRSQPVSNLPRLRISGVLLELDVTDLRFRLWEAERLFNDLYQAPLPPEEPAVLTRRTEGWPVGLQLFILGPGRCPRDDRCQTISALGGRSKSVQASTCRRRRTPVAVWCSSAPAETPR